VGSICARLNLDNFLIQVEGPQEKEGVGRVWCDSPQVRVLFQFISVPFPKSYVYYDNGPRIRSLVSDCKWRGKRNHRISDCVGHWRPCSPWNKGIIGDPYIFFRRLLKSVVYQSLDPRLSFFTDDLCIFIARFRAFAARSWASFLASRSGSAGVGITERQASRITLRNCVTQVNMAEMKECHTWSTFCTQTSTFWLWLRCCVEVIRILFDDET